MAGTITNIQKLSVLEVLELALEFGTSFPLASMQPSQKIVPFSLVRE